ncbi:Yippee/Mis18 [Globomyces pollinis-pini]|nr:Yippee/Mis18 [Globomyces pollinis-pini]
MGLVHKEYLDEGVESNVFVCIDCNTHLTTDDDIVSKAFRGQHGTAYLFDYVVNTYSGKAEERRMLTGLHVVRDVYCNGCQSILGWKYDKAYESSQKYKEGRYVLELGLIRQI